MAMACSTRMLAFLLLALAFTAAVAESRDAYKGSADRYACILTQESFPLASKGAGLTSANGKLCVLCEQYSTEALVYLRQKETQTEILSVLHHRCASLGPLRQQCMTLVDYYIPAFFLEIYVLKPEELCESAHLYRKGAAARSSTRGEAYGLCHHVLVKLLTMLKDPNTKLEIVGLLFKTCSKAKNYEPQHITGSPWSEARAKEREGGVRLLNHFIMGEMEYWWWWAAAAGTVSPRRRHQEQELPTTRTRARRPSPLPHRTRLPSADPREARPEKAGARWIRVGVNRSERLQLGSGQRRGEVADGGALSSGSHGGSLAAGKRETE
ncbi:uncharacterized protein LOC123448475 isoform X1 [Hordeum vulgare subsp. vulgare]|uniref:uncharacterized protein LOC123448475 isoform X1 n=1 Tax=Hordeum vulgare subsp. vulgare TaxID=112509 RepID=UPI001D1A33A3|nr:uncharacterized protein LOC123448475 isoform X1 [Hordeum vulgare subsp. vulgare]